MWKTWASSHLLCGGLFEWVIFQSWPALCSKGSASKEEKGDEEEKEKEREEGSTAVAQAEIQECRTPLRAGRFGGRCADSHLRTTD